MSSRLMMMTNKQKHEARSIVDRIKVRIPREQFSSSPAWANSNKRVNCEPQSCNPELLVQNYGNFKRSGEPARFMYYEEGSWLDFSKEVFESLKSGFLEGKPVLEVAIDGVERIFDFYRMMEIDFGTGCERSISWIDVSGKCYFPKTFVGGGDGGGGGFGDGSGSSKMEEMVGPDEIPLVKIENVTENLNSENPKIEIEIKIGNFNELNSNSSKRKRQIGESEGEKEKEEKTEASSSNDRREGLKKRKLIESDLGWSRWPKVRLLKEGEKNYSVLKKLFLSGLERVEPDATITAIRQCVRTDPLGRARFEVFQRRLEMMKAARGDANMVFAWHGTSAKGVTSILTHGFGMPNKKSGFGRGICLSPVLSPHRSSILSEVDDNGEKHVILCRVILGKCEKVEAGSRQLHPSSVDFDTGVDDLEHPKWYVVWCANMNSHILPEFVVSYKSSQFVPGQLHGLPFTKFVLNTSTALTEKLFSKIESSLHSSKIPEFRTLLRTFKDGKLAKYTFVMPLRSIVGDAMLLSIIREIRG